VKKTTFTHSFSQREGKDSSGDFLERTRTMGFDTLVSETQAKHKEMRNGTNREDVLRLIAEGKRPASQEENERPVGEDGKPLEKLQLAPGLIAKEKRLDSQEENERPVGEDVKPLEKLQLAPERDILRGEVPSCWPWTRDYRASAKMITRVIDGLAKMPPSEQGEWCLSGENGEPGGIAVAFRVGYPELQREIMEMLKNPEINVVQRGDMAKAIIDLKPEVRFIHEMLEMVACRDLHSSALENYIIKTIGSSHPDQEIIAEMNK
jgi:hypothetical protein